jgi:hypothetical protein
MQSFYSSKKCHNLLSDNDTNFDNGAKSELEALHKLFADPKFQTDVKNVCAQQQIEFHFIPPHFGGLWEAAVKSMKHHLTRIVGKTQLNFKGMTTILAKIEAILNWRPLVVESDDPEDPISITPGHFLIGRPPVAMNNCD